LSTKVEIKLRKANDGILWPQLTALAQNAEVDLADRPASYPSSNRKNVDWNKVDQQAAEEIENEKLEGDAALNKLFKDIYGRADEVCQRAAVTS